MNKRFFLIIFGILIAGVFWFLKLKNMITFNNEQKITTQQAKQESSNNKDTLSQYSKKPQHFWRGEVMSIKEVCQKWGEAPFNLKKFKEGDESTRAKMICSLLKNQTQYHGIERYKIREIFGKYSGHYFSDIIPTYFIEIATTKDQDTWQLVFLSDKNHKIANMIVHKNCCYFDDE